MRGLLTKLASKSLSMAGRFQGVDLMGKYEINAPKGVAVGSVEDIRNAIQDVLPKENELVVKSQILAGGRGLRTFKSGLKGEVHIVKTNEVEDIAGNQLLIAFMNEIQSNCFMILFENCIFLKSMLILS